MEEKFTTLSEGVKHERSSIVLLSLSDPDNLKQTEITDHQMNEIIKILLQKSFIDKKTLKEQVASQLLDEYILFNKWPIQIELRSRTVKDLNNYDQLNGLQ